MGRRGRRTKEMVSTARERMEILLTHARNQALSGNIEYSHRYVNHAMKIGMRYNIRMPSAFHGEFCRKCRFYLMPGRTSRIRLTRGKLTSTCLHCGNLRRYPYAGVRRSRRGDDKDG